MEQHLYKISTYSLGKHDHVEITKEQYEEIRRTRQFISFGLALEEKLDLLAENYADFERELINMSVQHSVFYGSIESLLIESRHRVNRRLINLLTSVRLYHDQIAHALNGVYGKNNKTTTQFRELSSNEYDNHLSYRALEALRNHVQHASLPITAITFNESAVERSSNGAPPGAPTKIRFTVTPYISIDDLSGNKEFKKSIHEELKTIVNKKNEIDIVPLVRQYISCIGRIHNNLRDICKADLDDAENKLIKYRAMAITISEGLAAIQYTKDNIYTDYIPLTDRTLIRWKHLKSRNSHLEQAAINFVSSEHD